MSLEPLTNEIRNGGLDVLSGQDRLFLLTETQEAHMHVGAALIFESGTLSRSARGVDFERIKQHVGARLRYIPRYRQRIGFTPLSSLPHWLGQSIRFGRQLQSWASAPIESTVRLGEQVAGVVQFLGAGLRPAPDSPLNRPIGSQRRFDWISFDLSEVKEVKRRLGGTINDVVLATVSGALHHFFSQHRRVRPVDLRALVPVNMRREGEAEAIGNHISAFLVRLPVSVVDPVRRLRSVKRRMEAIKASSQAAGGEILAGAGVPLLGTLMRFADRFNAFNVVITNVPGPPVPLYLAGARLQEIFPQVPLFPNQGLGIALFSYAGKLHWGLNADRELLPDLAEFKEALAASFEELGSAWPGMRTSAKAKVFRLIPRAKAV